MTSEQSNQPNNKPKPTPPSKSSWKPILVSMIFTTIVVFAVYYYLSFLITSSLKTVSDDPEQDNKISQLTTQLNELQANVDEAREQNQKAFSDITDTVQSQMRLIHQDKQAWRLEECAYLLKLAYYQLHYHGQVDTAVALLNTAKQKLAELAQDKYHDLQQKIQTAIDQLSAIPKVQVDEIMAILEALSGKISDLPLRTQLKSDVQITTETSPTSEAIPKTPDNWKTMLIQNLSILKNLVQVRRHDKPIQPLLSASEHQTIILQIRNKLLQSQWALLKHDAKTYQTSLHTAKQWISQYFNTDDTSTANVLDALDALIEKPIELDLPDIRPLFIELHMDAKQIEQKSPQAPPPQNMPEPTP